MKSQAEEKKELKEWAKNQRKSAKELGHRFQKAKDWGSFERFVK